MTFSSSLAELFLKTFLHIAVSILINPICIRDETNNSGGTNAVTRPTERLNIAVIKRFHGSGFSTFSVGGGNTSLKIECKNYFVRCR